MRVCSAARPFLLVVASLALAACGTTSGSAGGWGSARVHTPQPTARPAASAPSGRTPGTTPALPAAERPLPLPVADATRSGLLIPVVGVAPTQLRDTFHAARSGGRTHHAIDIAAPTGTPLVAITDGTVTRITWNRLGGRTLYLRSADGRYDFYYAHLDAYAPGLVAGQRVVRGEVIGTVGATGNAQGPHLHLQVLDLAGGGRGTPVNPYEMLRAADLVLLHDLDGPRGADH